MVNIFIFENCICDVKLMFVGKRVELIVVVGSVVVVEVEFYVFGF